MKTRGARIWRAAWEDRLRFALEAGALPEHVKMFYD